MKAPTRILCGLVAGLMLLQCVSSLLCPECICPASYSPLCAVQKNTGKLRGFSSLCVLECSNKCAKNKYEFAFRGRCGKRRSLNITPTTSKKTTTSTTTTTFPTTTDWVDS